MEKTREAQISSQELVTIVKSIPQVAKKNGWVFSLDKEEDALFYSPAIVPDGARLYQVNDEFAIYLDREKQLQGVMSEYFTHNFVKHHEDMQKLIDRVFDSKGKNDIDEVDPQRETRDEVKIFKGLFEKTLLAEACGADLHS